MGRCDRIECVRKGGRETHRQRLPILLPILFLHLSSQIKGFTEFADFADGFASFPTSA